MVNSLTCNSSCGLELYRSDRRGRVPSSPEKGGLEVGVKSISFVPTCRTTMTFEVEEGFKVNHILAA